MLPVSVLGIHSVFLCHGCCNKAPHSVLLKTAGMLCLTALGKKLPQVLFSLKALGRSPSLHCPGFQWLPAILGNLFSFY